MNTFLTNKADIREVEFNKRGRYIRTAEHKKSMDNAVVLMLDAIQSGNTCEVVHVAGIITRLNDYNADCELNEQIIQRIITVITSQTMRGDAFTSYDLARYLKERNIYIDSDHYPEHAVIAALHRLIDEGKIEKRMCNAVHCPQDTITVYIVK